MTVRQGVYFGILQTDRMHGCGKDWFVKIGGNGGIYCR